MLLLSSFLDFCGISSNGTFLVIPFSLCLDGRGAVPVRVRCLPEQLQAQGAQLVTYLIKVAIKSDEVLAAANNLLAGGRSSDFLPGPTELGRSTGPALAQSSSCGCAINPAPSLGDGVAVQGLAI